MINILIIIVATLIFATLATWYDYYSIPSNVPLVTLQGNGWVEMPAHGIDSDNNTFIFDAMTKSSGILLTYKSEFEDEKQGRIYLEQDVFSIGINENGHVYVQRTEWTTNDKKEHSQHNITEMMSKNKYNDGKWHSYIFVNTYGMWTLTIDNNEKVTTKSLRNRNVPVKLLFGGHPDTINPLYGCMRNIQIGPYIINNSQLTYMSLKSAKVNIKRECILEDAK